VLRSGGRPGADCCNEGYRQLCLPTGHQAQLCCLVGNAIEPGPIRKYRIKGVRLMIGAPVLNLDGELVGIATGSTAVLSLSDAARDVEELLAKVSDKKSDKEDAGAKGWLGITHIPINPDYARKYNLPRGGILVNTVADDGPAAAAGLQAGDLVVRVNGKDMRFSGIKAGSYFISLLRPRVDAPFTLTVVRDGKEKALAGTYGKPPKPKALKSKSLGINVRNIDSSLTLTQRLLTDKGVYVSDIDRGSPAAVSNNSGGTLLSKGDVITAIAGKATPDLKSFGSALEAVRQQESNVVLVAYARGKTTGYAALNLSLGDKK
jgi:serine protease Do